MCVICNDGVGVMGLTEEAKRRACDLLDKQQGGNSGWGVEDVSDQPILNAFAQYIQDVSDALRARDGLGSRNSIEALRAFILPEPIDPLVVALKEVTSTGRPTTEYGWKSDADALRAHLEAAGYTIARKDVG